MKNYRLGTYLKRFFKNMPAAVENIIWAVLVVIVLVLFYNLGLLMIKCGYVSPDTLTKEVPVAQMQIIFYGFVAILTLVIAVMLVFYCIKQLTCGYLFLKFNKKMVEQSSIFELPKDGVADYEYLENVFSNIGIELSPLLKKILQYSHPDGIYYPAKIPSEVEEWSEQIIALNNIVLSKEEKEKLKNHPFFKACEWKSHSLLKIMNKAMLPEDAKFQKYIYGEN